MFPPPPLFVDPPHSSVPQLGPSSAILYTFTGHVPRSRDDLSSLQYPLLLRVDEIGRKEQEIAARIADIERCQRAAMVRESEALTVGRRPRGEFTSYARKLVESKVDLLKSSK